MRLLVESDRSTPVNSGTDAIDQQQHCGPSWVTDEGPRATSDEPQTHCGQPPAYDLWIVDCRMWIPERKSAPGKGRKNNPKQKYLEHVSFAQSVRVIWFYRMDVRCVDDVLL